MLRKIILIAFVLNLAIAEDISNLKDEKPTEKPDTNFSTVVTSVKQSSSSNTSTSPKARQGIPTISFVNKNDNDGFQPSLDFTRALKNHASSHRDQSAKVKREEEPVLHQLFDGENRNPETDEQEEKEGRSKDIVQASEPDKTPRGYFNDESNANYRDYGPSSSYGNILPTRDQYDDNENEIDVVHNSHNPRPQVNQYQNHKQRQQQYQQFPQDPIPVQTAKYRSSPDKFQNEGEYSRPYNPPSFNSHSYSGGGHPYEFDGPSQYRGQSQAFGTSNQYGGGDNGFNNGGGSSSYHSSPPHTYHHHTATEGSHLTDSIRQLNSEIELTIGPAVGKALKLLLPSALLLTGVSALFPNRVYVPTQPKPQNLRQKRGADYVPVNDNEDIEYIPASLLRREHRTNEEDPVLYDYDDGTPNPYFGSYAAARKAKVQKIRPTLLAIEQQPTVNNNDNNNNNNNEEQSTKNLIPEFVPIPKSNGENDDDGDIELDSLPEQEYDIFKIRDQQKQKKEDQTFGKSKPGSAVRKQQKTNQQQQKINTAEPTLNTNVERVPGALSPELIEATRMSAPLARIMGSAPTTSIPSSTTTGTNNAALRNGDKKRPMRKRVNKAQQPATATLNSPSSTVVTISEQQSPIPTPTFASPSTSTTLTSKPQQDPQLVSLTTTAETTTTDNTDLSELFRKDRRINFLVQHQELVKPEPPVIKEEQKANFDLSPNGPVMGLLTAAAEHSQDSDICQRRALCDLAIRGTNPKATKFETFLWSLANLTPNAFTMMYDIDDVFQAIREKNCAKFNCANPNHDLQL